MCASEADTHSSLSSALNSRGSEAEAEGASPEPESLFPSVQVDDDLRVTPPSGSPTTDPAGRERIELTKTADRHLRRIADAIGLPPREVLGHLMKCVSRSIRDGKVPDATEVEQPLPSKDTVVLRHIPVGPVDMRRLRRWVRRTGQRPTVLVSQRILHLWEHLSAERLEETSTENPLDAYQLLLDVLHEYDAPAVSPPARGEAGGDSTQNASTSEET